MSNESNRGWWRKHFYDHPQLRIKHPSAFSNSGKAKVWCKLCFSQRMAYEKQLDVEQIGAGLRASVREESIIEAACMHLFLVLVYYFSTYNLKSF